MDQYQITVLSIERAHFLLAIKSCCTTDGMAGTGSHSSASRSLKDQPVDRFTRLAMVDTKRIAFPRLTLLYLVDGLRFPTRLPLWTRTLRAECGLVVPIIYKFNANTHHIPLCNSQLP